MNIQIISIGKLSSDIIDIIKHYEKMISWRLLQSELPHSKKNNTPDIMQDEAKLILAKIRPHSHIIALNVDAKQMTSQNFSQLFTTQMMLGNNIDFIIGGAFGLDLGVLAKADLLLSLSAMTLPHQLAKLLLIEQIYRAQSLINGHTYHK